MARKIADTKGITTATEEAKVEKTPCLCGQVTVYVEAATVNDLPRNVRWTAENDAADKEGFIHLTTGCEQLTAKTFAPGHDARLAGLLQAAHRLGGVVSDGDSDSEPKRFALAISDAFAAKVTKEVAPKAERATKARGKGATRPARIKVGRWEYDAQIDGEGTAFWTDGKGNERKTFDGAYTEV